jgi:sporulation protein YlmC with PRC-barrel domain
MTKKLLIAASVIAIMAGAPAFAETSANTSADVKVETNTQANPSLKEDAKHAWENTKEATSKAADKTAKAAEDAYENIKATFIDEDKKASDTLTVDARGTAQGMIGQPVIDTSGKKIATVKDIILDNEGEAELVVLADGGFMGIGSKLAAFDYDLVSQRNEDGDVIMPISQETLDKVAPFSYEAKDAEKDAKTRVIPADGISVAELLDGQILNTEKKAVAEVDNISFSNGEASQIIIGFDKTLGLGGEKAAVGFDNVDVVREKDKKVDVQLSAKQAANFENFKKTATN